MRIIVTVRTRNEEKNIARFCLAYQWADEILVADGGSSDNTVLIARNMPNTKVKHFTERAYKDGAWRNPHGAHMNYLFEWAEKQNADWIVFDDCDCIPTKSLQLEGRRILDECYKPSVFAFRLYIVGKDKYYPDMNTPGQSLWAWRAPLNLRALEDDPFVHEMDIPPKDNRYLLWRPYALKHYFAPDKETNERKQKFYESIGRDIQVGKGLGCGHLENLPDWVD